MYYKSTTFLSPSPLSYFSSNKWILKSRQVTSLSSSFAPQHHIWPYSSPYSLPWKLCSIDALSAVLSFTKYSAPLQSINLQTWNSVSKWPPLRNRSTIFAPPTQFSVFLDFALVRSSEYLNNMPRNMFCSLFIWRFSDSWFSPYSLLFFLSNFPKSIPTWYLASIYYTFLGCCFRLVFSEN